MYSYSEVLELRESRSRPDVGVAQVPTTGFNQYGAEVIIFRRTLLVYKQGQVPARATSGEDERVRSEH